MESLNRNPNKYKSKGDGINLRAELNGLLEEELKQSPEKIDTKKIDAIIELLSHLEGDRMTVQEKEDTIFQSRDIFYWTYSLCQHLQSDLSESCE